MGTLLGVHNNNTQLSLDIKGILAAPPKATPTRNKALLRAY